MQGFASEALRSDANVCQSKDAADDVPEGRMNGKASGHGLAIEYPERLLERFDLFSTLGYTVIVGNSRIHA